MAMDSSNLSLDVNVAHNLMWILCPQFRGFQNSGHDFFFGPQQKKLRKHLFDSM